MSVDVDLASRRPLAALEDAELIADGSAEAVGELYARYCDRAYRLAQSVVRDGDRAQDAVQEAFLSIWRSRLSYVSQDGTVAAWLLTTVRHRAIDLLSADRGRLAEHGGPGRREAHAIPGTGLAQAVVRQEEANLVQATLMMLPDPQQEVIALAYYGRLSHTEIAAQLGLPTGTVKGRMRLGLQELRRTLHLESSRLGAEERNVAEGSPTDVTV